METGRTNCFYKGNYYLILMIKHCGVGWLNKLNSFIDNHMFCVNLGVGLELENYTWH